MLAATSAVRLVSCIFSLVSGAPRRGGGFSGRFCNRFGGKARDEVRLVAGRLVAAFLDEDEIMIEMHRFHGTVERRGRVMQPRDFLVVQVVGEVLEEIHERRGIAQV